MAGRGHAHATVLPRCVCNRNRPAGSSAAINNPHNNHVITRQRRNLGWTKALKPHGIYRCGAGVGPAHMHAFADLRQHTARVSSAHARKAACQDTVSQGEQHRLPLAHTGRAAAGGVYASCSDTQLCTHTVNQSSHKPERRGMPACVSPPMEC